MKNYSQNSPFQSMKMILLKSKKGLINSSKKLKIKPISKMFVFQQILNQVILLKNLDIDDVNNALKEINEALNEKIALTELQAILKDQSAINETLCSENIVGRWMWQSGDLKPGSLIPWEIQSANTVPEHFFW